jgi:hypothetical protein
MVGVLSFGRGLFDREPIKNGKTSYKVFYRLKAEHVVMSQLFGWEGALALSSEQFAGKFVSPQFPTFLCDTKKLDREFLGWLMRRPMFWEDLGSRTSGMGDRRRTLNPEALFSCEIVLPPLEEQGRIVARIGEFTAKIQEARDLRKQAAEEAEALVVSTHLRLAGSRNRKLLGAELVDLLSGPDLSRFGLCLSCRTSVVGTDLGTFWVAATLDASEGSIPILRSGISPSSSSSVNEYTLPLSVIKFRSE